MGVDSRKAPPLPAPTDTDTGIETEVATDLSRVTDKSSYSIPEDGSPITISTRRRKDGEGLTRASHQSQTSLLIEYFEGGKGSQAETRRPSVRVKVTPSSKSRSRSTNEHIQITETTKGGRKPSYTKRINLSSPHGNGERVVDFEGDGRSVSSFNSATEESNVSRNPIEIEVMPRRHGSPLIPMENDSSRDIAPHGSDISSMPANSFLDGKTRSPERKRSRSLTRGEALAGGVATGLVGAAIADNLKTPSRRRSRSLSRERIVAQKAVEKVKADKSERRRKHSSGGGGSRSRSVSNSENHTHSETIKSPRRRSSRTHGEESYVSRGDSSLLTSSGISGDQRSFRSGTSKSSINNPKLLETVEDAIRRLILPELTALKKEQKANANRDKFERDRRGSITSGSGISRESKDEASLTRKVSNRASAPDISGRVRSSGRDRDVSGETIKPRKERRSDHFGSDDSPRNSERLETEEAILRGSPRSNEKRSTAKRSGLGALAAGIGLGALTSHALQHHDSKDSMDEKHERRRRRTKSHSRSDSLAESYEETQRQEHPPLPMMSDINSSEVTRASILSAETEHPYSASAEHLLTPVRDVARGVGSPSLRTPTRSPGIVQNKLRTVHSNDSRDNLSHDDLHKSEYELNEQGQKVPMTKSSNQSYADDYYDNDPSRDRTNGLTAGLAGAAGGAILGATAMHYRNKNKQVEYDSPVEDEDEYYQNDQQVPSPLRYVPYNQTKRGLSPIQSVSGWTEADELERLNQQRDSRLTRSAGSYSTLDRSPHIAMSAHADPTQPDYYDFQGVRQGGLTDSELTQDQDGEYWDEQHRENDRNRDLDAASYQGSDPRIDSKRTTGYTDESGDHQYQDRAAAGQNVKGLGAIPDYIHTPFGVESAVASLVSASELTGESGRSGVGRQASYASYDEGSERHFTSRGNSPAKNDHDNDNNTVEYSGSEREYPSQRNSPSKYQEYDLDEQGRKVAIPEQQHRHTTAKAGLAGIAAGAAAAILAGRRHEKPESSETQYEERQDITGAPLQRSFKDRANEMQDVSRSPRHSIDKLEDHEDHDHFKMTASGLPVAHDPLPEIGYGDEASSIMSSTSVIRGPAGGEYHDNQDHWSGHQTPTQPKLDIAAATRSQHSALSEHSDSGLKAAELGLLGASVGAGAAAALAHHNKEAGHSHDDEWQRTSEDRKRDTLLTNPYEGTSPVTLLGGQQDRHLLENLGYEGVTNNNEYGKLGYSTGSPGLLPKDEGYISSAPNARSPGVPEQRSKGVGFMDDVGMGVGEEDLNGDPFYTPKHSRHLSGMSHGMDSPLYDSATGYGKDRIQSKDIVALMDHLTVRDAQRSARDTEILVTLVRAAAEMRNSFEDMKKLLAETEDVVITEVQRNTDNSVQKVINGPRPPPPSALRSTRGSQDDIYDDLPNKRRNVFRRALKGLSMKSHTDLGKIENMLVQLLGDVEGLKVAQGLRTREPLDDDYDLQQEGGTYENDHGYEPEGNAGTSTASHASQSGHFSLPLSRGTSATRGFGDRKFSENRISTVQEDDEEELDPLSPHEEAVLHNQFENNEHLLTPVREKIRGGSAPLGTPPQNYIAPASRSNENTPKMDKGKKSKSSWNPIPKISRWSGTTASTVARGFRSSGRRDTDPSDHPSRSRSGSDLDHFDSPQDQYIGDKLNSGFSHDNYPEDQYDDDNPDVDSLLPPEDPKYKAHRNSLNLQHPQPRPGPTHRYQTALESQAQDFSHPKSPKSMDWGSSTSINRLPPNQNRYSNGTNGTNDTGAQSPISEGGYSQPSAGAGLTPARPPKEPISTGPERPPKIRPNKLAKPSPLSLEHIPVDSDENKRLSNGTAGSSVQYEGSPRRVSGMSLGVPARKPTGPRSMGDSVRSRSANLSGDEAGFVRNKNRDTFGTIASNHSGESETF